MTEAISEIRYVTALGWSYKGGSGRTTAALNTAYALATHGRKVVLVDIDVGAPEFEPLESAGQ